MDEQPLPPSPEPTPEPVAPTTFTAPQVIMPTEPTASQPVATVTPIAPEAVTTPLPVTENPIVTTATPSGPTIMAGQDASSYKSPTPSRVKILLIAGGSVIVLLLVGVVLYLKVLPQQDASSYTKTIPPLYKQQTADMTSVYQTLDRQVFVSNDSSQATDTSDLSYITNAIQTANASTSALKAKNHLTVLPGTAGMSSLAKADIQYKAMQTYVTDSQNFLSVYKSYVNYVSALNTMSTTQLAPLVADLGTITASAGSQSAILSAVQQTTTQLTCFSTQIKKLTPPTDLQQYNTSLLNDLTGMNSSLTDLSSSLQGNTSVNLDNALGGFQTAINNFYNLLNTNPTASLPTNSALHTDVVALQAENPLQ
jgi:hypothetical protein